MSSPHKIVILDSNLDDMDPQDPPPPAGHHPVDPTVINLTIGNNPASGHAPQVLSHPISSEEVDSSNNEVLLPGRIFFKVEGEVALKVPVHDRSDHWKNPDKL
jgi:hypothetical protein